VFAVSFPGLESLKTIYQSILIGHVSQGFSSQIQRNADRLVNAALELHQKVTSSFLPTAIKFHYIFNLRDLSNIFQVQANTSNLIFLLSSQRVYVCVWGGGDH
jgi:dynein heavy chain